VTLKESREIYALHMRRRREHPSPNSRPLKPLRRVELQLVTKNGVTRYEAKFLGDPTKILK
jgi:hypothetical protein